MSDHERRKPGRPPKTDEPGPEQFAEVAAPTNSEKFIPAMNCPKCGAFIKPRLERWEQSGRASLVCTSDTWRLRPQDACLFTYWPARVQIKATCPK